VHADEVLTAFLELELQIAVKEIAIQIVRALESIERAEAGNQSYSKAAGPRRWELFAFLVNGKKRGRPCSS
jgi:hypothetical protein